MRYFIGFLVTVGLIVLLIVLIFHGNGTPSSVPASPATLNSYADTDAVAQITIDGPINADQTHQQIQISVGQNEANFKMFQGYDGNVTSAQSFANTQASYSAFLSALNQAGFTKGSTSSTTTDINGLCPLGERYTIQLTQDGHDIENYWATSCPGPRTYGGSLSLTLSLFQAQIPGYDTLSQTFLNETQ